MLDIGSLEEIPDYLFMFVFNTQHGFDTHV